MNCLEGECVAHLYISIGVSILTYLSLMGWPGIYSVCYSQLVCKDYFPFDEIILAFIGF